MRLPLRKYLPLSLMAVLAACPCDPSSPGGRAARATSTNAEVRSPTGDLQSFVGVFLSETRGDPWPRSLNVSFTDPVFGTPSALSGHITHIRLLDGALHSVQEIETYPGTVTTQSIVTGTVFFPGSETSRYDAMRDLFISGKTVLEIETDLPGQERIRIALSRFDAGGWATSSCD